MLEAPALLSCTQQTEQLELYFFKKKNRQSSTWRKSGALEMEPFGMGVQVDRQHAYPKTIARFRPTTTSDRQDTLFWDAKPESPDVISPLSASGRRVALASPEIQPFGSRSRR